MTKSYPSGVASIWFLADFQDKDSDKHGTAIALEGATRRYDCGGAP